MAKDDERVTEIVFPALYKDPKTNKYVYRRYKATCGISGDTDSCYMKLPFLNESEDDIEGVCEIADTIGQHVNGLFPEFIMDAFNAPESRKHTIETDREIVADKSFFVTKKRYAAHVVNKEGKYTDEMKIMGLEIRKSNTAAIMKDMLLEVVNRVLDGYDADQMLDLVDRFKRDYYDAEMEDIAKPTGCGTLKAAQEIYHKTGSMKGLHYTARAALFYNSLCGPADRTILPGDKVGLLYIVDPRSKYIAYPLDATTLPDFMDDIAIDYRTQWDKAHGTIENYLEAMEFDLKSRKRNLKKNLFGFGA